MNAALPFHRHALADPGAPALRRADESLSYGALHELVTRFAAMLDARGIGPGSRVAILLPNDPAFPVALLGTMWGGAVAVVLSRAWPAGDAARALAQGDARLLVTTSALAAAIGADPSSTLTVDDDGAMGMLGAALRGVAGTTQGAPAPVPDDAPASILFSSGTTGDPRGVVLTHGNLAFNARAKIRYCGITPADRLAMIVPMSHCFGQNVVLLGALLAGASVTIHSRFDAERLREDIAGSDVTMLLAAPTAFSRLLDAGDGAALRRLRYALSAAAPLPDQLAARWHEATGRPLAQGYGLTECSPFAAYEDAVTEDGSRVGRAIDGVAIRIASPDGAGWMADGSAGEIAIRGPNVMAGYWRKPAPTASVLRDGWLYTRDVGFLDEGGALHLVDRMDDVINVAGFKAWPSDVERVLRGHAAVEDAAAYAIPDAVRGSLVSAAIVLRAGVRASDALLADVAAFAARSLASYQRPTRLHVMPALPRSATGKVLRRSLAAEARLALPL